MTKNRTKIRIRPKPEETDGPVNPPPADTPPEPDRGRVADGDLPRPADPLLPTGPIRTAAPWGRPYTFAWEQITQWVSLVRAAATEHGVPWQRLLATIPTESGGNPRAVQRNPSNGDSFGLVQVVPYGVGWEGWYKLVRDVAGLSTRATTKQVQDALYDPEINLRVGASILSSFKRQYGTWDRASSAFFLGNPDWDGEDSVNGNTGAAYKRSLDGLIAEIEAAANGEDQAPDQGAEAPNGGTEGPPVRPQPASVDPIATIVGTRTYTADYGWLSDVGLNLYAYGVNHGTTASTQHTGIDVPLACGTPLYSPGAGVVDCVGSRGTPRWGQNCGAYADTDGGGVGNLTILLDSGVKLTLGHVRDAFVKPGDRVSAGQKVATVGSQNGCHVHIETSVQDGNSYRLVEPRAALAPLMTPDPRAGLVERQAVVIEAADGRRVTDAIWLPAGVKFSIHLTPRGMPNRTGTILAASKTIWHETANPRPTADAMDHAIWQAGGAKGHPDGPVSVHFYVDDAEIVQCLPLNERGIHAGDTRNGTSWGIERCVNQGIDHAKAESNAAYLHATLLRDVLGTTVEAMEPHTRNACPATINGNNRWTQVSAQVAGLMNAGAVGPLPPSPPLYPGLSIPVPVFEALWQNPKVQPDPNGPYTKFVIANKLWSPIHSLVRVSDDESYLVTSSGLLHYVNGKVEKVP